MAVQPVVNIQSTPAQVEAQKNFYNRNQFARYRYYGVTTSNVQTEIFIDGISGKRLVIPKDSVMTIQAVGAAIQTTGTVVGGNATVTASALNNNGASAIVANQVVTTQPASPIISTPAVTVTNNADPADDTMNLLVTGILNQTVIHEYLVTVVCASNPETLTDAGTGSIA